MLEIGNGVTRLESSCYTVRVSSVHTENAIGMKYIKRKKPMNFLLLFLFCSANGNLTKILLENDADPNTVDKRGFSPLHDAARKRKLLI